MSEKSNDDGINFEKQSQIHKICTQHPPEIEKSEMNEVQLTNDTENIVAENEERHTRKENSSENICKSHMINNESGFSETNEDITDQHESLTSPDLNNLKMVLKKRAFSLPEDISIEKLDCCDFPYPNAKRTKQQISCKINNTNSENIPPETTHQKKNKLTKSCRNAS